MGAKPQIVITGAAGGIGAALARHFLANGCSVTGVDIAPIDQEGPDFFARIADVTDERAMEAVFDEMAGRGPLSAVIANAAVTDLAHRDTLDLPYADWSKVQRVNVDGAFITARGAARRMVHSGAGNIVFVTSSLAFLSDAKANDAPYCSSKAAIEMLARVMALELAPKGVNVNTLFPSAIIDTGFFAHWDEDQRATLAPATILNETAAFLASLAPGQLTGHSLDHARWDNDRAYRDSLEGAA